MRYYCVELDWNFNSMRLAYVLMELGLTVIQRGFCLATVGGAY